MKISLHLLFIFFFFFIYIPYVTSEPRYTPVENVALDCGSPGNQTADDDRRWIGDDPNDDRFVLIEEESSEKSITSRSISQESSVDTVPYRTARISRSKFTYSFRVSVPGPKFVRLHFYPDQYERGLDVRGSFFTVKAGPFTLLKNFSASLFANYMNQLSFFKEFCLHARENIDLTFVPASSSSYAFVNAVEFVSMPETLYYAPEDDPLEIPHLIGQKSGSVLFGSYSDRALETLYRLNVGGRTIPPNEDTGMYREWSRDSDDYFIGKAVTPFNTNLPLKYTTIANYTAPDEVYQTALTMGRDAASNRARNMTWRLPVDRGFFYLVRLHFCQIQEIIKGPYDMVFYLYIDQKMAESAVNVVSWTGGHGNGIPVYRDYVVNIRDKDNLFIAVHPRGDESYYDDAIVNGIEVFKMSNTSDKNLAGPNPGNTTRNPPSPMPEEPGSKKRTVLIVSLGVCLGCAVLFAAIFVLFLKKKMHRKRRSSMRSTKGSSLLPEDLCRHFLLWEIRSATREFDKMLIIGRGGFGDVYKGFIDGDESKPVAVKRLNVASNQGDVEFVTEINLLSTLRHVHLVSLIGYCDEKREMILVYEYIANGTLREHLYGPNHEPLPWQTRLKVCIGAARGLQYLHEYAKDTIIHRDVKTANILLDKKWEAKVADFGMSKIGPSGGGAVSTMVKGTPGYLDPEYAQSEKLTDKTDVYSFGVVLFEVLCARKPYDPKLDHARRNLADWARKCARDGSVHEIIDPFLMGKIAPECFKKFVEVAESCLRDTGDRRPSMGEVREKLEFALELQEQADAAAAAEQAKNPGAGGVIYHPVVSFHLADDDRRDEFDLLGLRLGTGSRAAVGSGSTAGVSFVSLETESRSDIFSEKTCSSVSEV